MTKSIKCAYCNGTGKDPFSLLSAMSDCHVCDGTAQVVVRNPATTCAFCSGTGKNPLGARIPCIVCGGKGNNYCESNSICYKCRGTGKSIDGLPCTRCRGKGLIRH